MYIIAALSSLFLTLPFALAKDIPISVGANAKLAFSPDTVTADVGDTLTFSYYPKNHSVAQSNFNSPCHPLAGGFFSGFQPLSAGPGPVEFVVTVNDTKPIWIYCSQTKGNHCQMGMAMVVNQPAPPSPNTLDAYKLAAAKTGNSTSPPKIEGGVFTNRNGTSTASGTATASTGFGVVPTSLGGSSTATTASTEVTSFPETSTVAHPAFTGVLGTLTVVCSAL
ncbi:hypothetical protein ACLMJK_007540 [Lecanora helva]